MVSKKDLLFLAREYESIDIIPKEKRYLLEYFRKEVQQSFLKYFFVFKDFDNFVDHTGLYCQKRWLKILHRKLVKLESVHNEAKVNMDLDMLTKIEDAQYDVVGFLNYK